MDLTGRWKLLGGKKKKIIEHKSGEFNYFKMAIISNLKVEQFLIEFPNFILCLGRCWTAAGGRLLRVSVKCLLTSVTNALSCNN